jgi:hypothetical protein
MRAQHSSFFEIKVRLTTNSPRFPTRARAAGAEQFVMALKQALSMR